ncbi:hypothetical protein J6590_034123 [Homalodisca vitripennis]|nr:hypothetical protein J6590_034123 [Homalodisca vitripennis]
MKASHKRRCTTREFQQFHKTTKNTILGKFTTLFLTTKDSVALPCYRRTINEKVFSSFLPLIKHSTGILLGSTRKISTL